MAKGEHDQDILEGDPIRPNLGQAAQYKRELIYFMRKMYTNSIEWLKSGKWQITGIPNVDTMSSEIRSMAKNWEMQAESAGRKLSEHLVSGSLRQTDQAFTRMLKKSGFTAKFQVTPSMDAAMKTVVHDNVALIKDIPAKHFKDLEHSVMRAARKGMDLSELVPELQEKYGLSKKRAHNLALDQVSKATAEAAKQRMIDIGMDKAVWKHSGIPKNPRHSHIHATGRVYKISEGCYIDGEYIQPGEKPNCRCLVVPVMAGFELGGKGRLDVFNLNLPKSRRLQ